MGPVSEFGLEIKQLTGIKQSQIQEPGALVVLRLYLNLNQESMHMGKAMPF